MSGGGGGSEIGGGGGGGRATSTERICFLPSLGLSNWVSGKIMPMARAVPNAPRVKRTGLAPNFGDSYDLPGIRCKN